eukprot:755873-Hanusia_phi.AAC.2
MSIVDLHSCKKVRCETVGFTAYIRDPCMVVEQLLVVHLLINASAHVTGDVNQHHPHHLKLPR